MVTNSIKRLLLIFILLLLPIMLIGTMAKQVNTFASTNGIGYSNPYILDINPGTGGSGALTTLPAGHIFSVNKDLMYFDAFDPIYGSELRISDGTITNTMVISDITPGSSGTWIGAREFIDDTLFFIVLGNLWRTDGTITGTQQVQSGLGTNVNDLINLNGELYIRADGGLWKSNGTEIGTQQFVSGLGDIKHLTPWNESFYFRADDGSGRELWKSDGTVTGTVRIKDIDPAGGSNPDELTVFKDRLYFVATEPNYGHELWVSDGTESGTNLFKEINPVGDSSPGYLTVVNELLFFTADNGVNGVELWVSDGTEAGTHLVKDINPNGDSNPSRLQSGNGIVYFMADDDIHGNELWISDGTESGTSLVKDINPNGDSTTQLQTTHLSANGLYFITLDDSIHGVELWVSDGTEDGTHIVADINPNGDSILWYTTSPDYMNGTLYFSADDGSNGHEVWAYDIGPKAVDIDPQSITEQVISSNDGQLTIRIPSGVLPLNSHKLQYHSNLKPPQPFSPQFAGVAFSLNLLDSNWIEIENPTFNPPLIVDIQYNPELLPNFSSESDIMALFFNESTDSWDELTIINQDFEENIITVEVPHFTNFALGTPYKLFLPTVLRD